MLRRLSALIFFFLIVVMSTPSLWSQTVARKITITIIETDTKLPIAHALVTTEGRTTHTDVEGRCRLRLATGSQIEVRAVGYKPHKHIISEGDQRTLTIALQSETLDEVTVTAEKLRTQSTTIAVRLANEALERQRGKSLADLLNQLPGMSSISSGATIAKPVIQGMHSSRILLINNGVRLEGQQWGADHAPEIDPSAANEVEVVKGAESIRYGAGAIGGVVLLNSVSPLETEGFGGTLALRGSSNARGMGMDGHLYGGFSPSIPIRWQIQGAAQQSGDYSTAEYVLNNTGNKEMSTSATLAMRFGEMTLDLHGSLYSASKGVFYGAHIGTLDDLLARFEAGRPEITDPASRSINNPKQEVLHATLRAKAKYSINGHALTAQYDLQSNHRNEYERRPGKYASLPAMGLLLTTHAAQAAWLSPTTSSLRGIVGGAISVQHNRSRTDTGAVPLIPNYASFTGGTYAIAKYISERYEIEGGVRYDHKWLNAKGYDHLGKAYGGDSHLGSYSWSLSGLLRPLPALSIISNIGMAWRAPDVNELYSNGLHHGAAAYEVGDPHLTPERSIKWNNEVRLRSNIFALTASAFVQSINGYIYAAPQRDQMTGEPETKILFAGVFPLFRYQQGDALFYGGEASVTIKPLSWCSYTVEGEWLRAHNRSTKGYFPYIPSDRYRHRLELTWQDHVTASLSHQYVTKQRRFDPGIDFLPETPNAYHLVGVEISYAQPFSKGEITLSLSADNLLNALYKEYTNRFRYYAHEQGRDLRLNIQYKF